MGSCQCEKRPGVKDFVRNVYSSYYVWAKSRPFVGWALFWVSERRPESELKDPAIVPQPPLLALAPSSLGLLVPSSHPQLPAPLMH